MQIPDILTQPLRLSDVPPARVLIRRGSVLLSRTYPRICLALVMMAAGAGYALLLVFPGLVIIIPPTLYESAALARTPVEWLQFGARATLLLLGVAVTATLIRLRFPRPAGRPVTATEAPGLYRLLAELHDAYGKPPIHRVLLGDGFDVRMVRTPRSGLLPFTRRTLVIGLPLLQVVSPGHMRALLARSIGQLPWRNFSLAAGLHQMNEVWRQYAALRHHPSATARLVGTMFGVYAPLYQAACAGASRLGELHADRCALDVIDDRTVAEAVSFEAAGRAFLARRYWPAIERMAHDARTCPPFRHLGEVARNGLSGPRLDEILGRLHAADTPDDDLPALTERLENIGHDHAPPLHRTSTTAARAFLGGALPSIVGWFDERWRHESRGRRAGHR